MRIRNVKNKEEILKGSKHLLMNPEKYKGKWKEVFSNDHQVMIEIGMGKGDFIIQLAQNNPSINYIGIEKFDSIIAKALQKIPEGLDNLYLIRENALSIDLLFDKEIDGIYLNFSDPWPKKRHHFRRLTSTIFLDKYKQLFKEDQEIIMKTDNPGLFSYSVENLSKQGYILHDVTFDLHKTTKEEIVMTEYEKKFVSKGMPIYHLRAIKKSDGSL